ncbi:MAG: hypothetical protein BWY79_00375 [Actinobacteria bacterium ADurb.Bin444]|nr:MAG: hypothetical protein BWY79_00375 [Actinobacteria bacterium ADurb.Bin444]
MGIGQQQVVPVHLADTQTPRVREQFSQILWVEGYIVLLLNETGQGGNGVKEAQWLTPILGNRMVKPCASRDPGEFIGLRKNSGDSGGQNVPYKLIHPHLSPHMGMSINQSW